MRIDVNNTCCKAYSDICRIRDDMIIDALAPATNITATYAAFDVLFLFVTSLLMQQQQQQQQAAAQCFCDNKVRFLHFSFLLYSNIYA